MGQTNFILVFCGFMIFIWFLYMHFYLLNIYTHMCLYLQRSTFRIYAMSLTPHVILTVLILGFQKAVCGIILERLWDLNFLSIYTAFLTISAFEKTD